jgi:aspartokinase
MKRHSAKLADTRDLIVTDSNFGDAQPLDAVSKKNTIQILKKIKIQSSFTGFIGSNTKQETTTLGRNGSIIPLIANYINAEELQNFTHVDGITLQTQSWYWMQKIESLSYNEANEMANFERIFYMPKPSFRC